MNIRNRHSQSDFAHCFNFHYLKNFAKDINLLWKASLWCVLLREPPIYTSKNNRYIPLRCAKFELECLLIIFIYFNSKFRVICENEDFKYRCIKIHFDEKRLRFLLFHSPFCFFSPARLNCHPE